MNLLNDLYHFPETPWPIVVPAALIVLWIILTGVWPRKPGKVADINNYPRAQRSTRKK